MKKITLLLVFLPVFLMTALNFTEGSTVDEHPPYMKAFTCSSCHATIINNIIISGKVVKGSDAVEVTLVLPNDLIFNAVQVDIIGKNNPKKANFPVYEADDYGTIYNTSVDKDLDGKKANEIIFEIPMSEFVEGEDLEIQGLLTNADGSSKGDYSFYEKVILEKKSAIEEIKKFSIYPTVANSQITIKDVEENALVSILNVSGQLVYQNVIANQEEIIDVSDFENGYYFMQTGTEENYATTKFIVSK
jgi:hypothetical protein